MKVTAAVHILVDVMQQTDAKELVIEVGNNGGRDDGARYLIHILKQCPECAVEEEQEIE